MSRAINTHCALRLGDNLAHLHFLRALAYRNPGIQFTHGAQMPYLAQLLEVVADLDNIRLIPLEYISPVSIDVWKNADLFWEKHPLKNDYAAFYLEFFHRLASRLELESPFTRAADLLFDYPAIRKAKPLCEPFEVLVINSPPQSNQWEGYDEAQLTALIAVLARRRKVITTWPCRLDVACTQKQGFSVTSIGTLSLQCKNIVMVSTGPSWPTFNIWNQESVDFRIVLIDREKIELGGKTEHCDRVNQARLILELRGVI